MTEPGFTVDVDQISSLPRGEAYPGGTDGDLSQRA